MREVIDLTAGGDIGIAITLLDSDNTVMGEVDFQALRRRVGSLTQRELLTVAAQLGWELDSKRGKGSHVVIRKGRARMTVPRKPAGGTMRRIIDALEREE